MPTPTFVQVPDLTASGDTQMGIDQQILNAVDSGNIAGALRFYRFNPPTITVGRHQAETTLNTTACARDGIEIVRRETGGTAVYHGPNDITYAFTCRIDHPVLGGGVVESCAAIHDVIQAALMWLDIPTTLAEPGKGQYPRKADCFAEASTCEILDFRQRKLVGSAQQRTGQALLQHGLIPMDCMDMNPYITDALSFSERTSIHVLEPHLTWDHVVAQLKNSFATAVGMPFVETGILLSESAGVG